MDNLELLEEAKKARLKAYTPYSNFKVGAALLTKSGKVYLGCNIEGEREFEKIAIVGAKDGDDANKLCAPCGVCRQVMMEFCNPKEFQIILADGENTCRVMTLEELLPCGFSSANLK